MTFLETLIEENMPIWQQYLDHPFIKGMAEGSLSLDLYHQYLIEDTLYLKEFGRVYAYALYKADTLAQMRYFYEMLSIVQKNEAYSRILHLQELGEDMDEVENRNPDPVNQMYTAYMLNIAKSGQVIDVLAASLPCMVSYRFIADHYVQRSKDVLKHHFYGQWFSDYSNENYSYYTKRWSDLFNQLAESISHEHQNKIRKIFKECSLHELNFWNMAYQKGKENE
ncbi:MAG: thiaminase II [Beduini sp.]|uniref:thiaminase II n=1 Tax=Beduini sp. TaxID=1922300 RepID=UPI00399F1B01